MKTKRITLKDLETRYADFCATVRTVKQAVLWQDGQTAVRGNE